MGSRSVGRRGTTRGRPGSSLDRWLASWRFALRLGSREVRRHKARSALIMALVATPVLLITAFLSFFMSQDISQAEGMDRRLGHAVAAVSPSTVPMGHVSGVGMASDAADGGKVASGYDLADPWDSERIAATVGAPVVRVGRTEAVLAGDVTHDGRGDGSTPLSVLALEGTPGGVTEPLVSPSSGRWATSEGEVVVTPVGIGRGLPESGTVSLRLGQDEEPTSFRVVGVADAAYGPAQNAALVLPATAAPEATQWEWLVDRTEPVLLAEATTWAQHGLDVSSREVELNPPPQDDWRSENAMKLALFYSMIGLAVLVETVLLAGPAFAVSAARQKHSLALAGAQGAAREDVRRAVVAYGLVLATVATVAAAALGAALGLGGALVLARLRPENHVRLELPWLWVGLLVAASILAAGVAAWWPARGATRLDIMSVLRGQVVSGPVRRGWPLAGAVMALAGIVALARAATALPYQATPWMVGGAVLLGLGAMLLVPTLLALVSRLSGGAPLAMRLAARDSMRQRSRAVPAVLAIIAAVGVMSAAATVQVSSKANQERQYSPLGPLGTISVHQGETDDLTAAVTRAVSDRLPGATAYPSTVLPNGPGMDEWTGQPVDRPMQTVVAPECTAGELTTKFVDGQDQPCLLEGHDIYAVVQVEALERTGALTSQMRHVLESGGMLLLERELDGGVPPGPGERIAVTAAARTEAQEDGAELTGPATLTKIPVFTTTAAQMDGLRMSLTQLPSGYLTAATAERLGWEGRPGSIFVAGTGPLTTNDAAALKDALVELNPHVYLERGFVPDPSERIVTLAMLGIFSLIALAAVVISTALTISEGQRDSATLAAIGGTRRTRRAVAAMHAVLVGAVGALVGLVLGMTIGGVMAWVQTSANFYGSGYGGWMGDAEVGQIPGIVAVPWASLGLAALAIPLIAAAVAWLSVRRAPVLTRAIT